MSDELQVESNISVENKKKTINYCLLCESEECEHIKEAVKRREQYKLKKKNIIWH